MKTATWAALAAGLLVAAAAPAEEAKKDQEQIQGTWKLMSAERGGKPVDLAKEEGIPSQIVFAGDKFTAAGKDKEHKGTFKLDATKKPKEIDLAPADGPNKDKPMRAVYALEGDTLRICVDEGETGQRPKELASKEGSRAVVAVFKRDKK